MTDVAPKRIFSFKARCFCDIYNPTLLEIPLFLWETAAQLRDGAAFVRILCLALAILATAGLSIAETITTSVSSGADSFNLTAGSANNPAATSITATTAWSLSPPYNLYVYGYFLNSTAALTDGAGHNIPSSAFFISVNGGNSTALNSNAANTAGFGGAGAGLQLDFVNVVSSNKVGSISDAMTFNIDLSALSQMPAGTYTGTLYIQAQGVKGNNTVNSGPQPITVTATLPESLTISLSGSSVTFSLVPGRASNPGNTTVTATTSWVMRPSRTSVGLYAYFTSAGAALSDGAGDSIPSSAFSISDNGGAATALTNTVVFGGANAGLQLSNVAITGANENSSRTDALSFNINLTGGTLPQLPAATYTGTLYIQAQTTP